MSILLFLFYYIYNVFRGIHTQKIFFWSLCPKSFVAHSLKIITRPGLDFSLFTPLTPPPESSQTCYWACAVLPISWMPTLSQLGTGNQNYFSQDFKILTSLSACFKISSFFLEACRLKRRKNPNLQVTLLLLLIIVKGNNF